MAKLIDRTPTSYDKEYPYRLGRLIANLSSLDFNLRVALYLMDTPRESRRTRSFKLKDLQVGEEIENSWLNDDCYLSDLILEYNKKQASARLPQIDAGIIDLRNALAHGYIIAGDEASPAQTCIKFARQKKGSQKTAVESKHLMTFEWIREQSGRVVEAAMAVNTRLHELAQE